MLTSLFAGNFENKKTLFDMLLTGRRPRTGSALLGLRLAEAAARPAALASAVPATLKLTSLVRTELLTSLHRLNGRQFSNCIGDVVAPSNAPIV